MRRWLAACRVLLGLDALLCGSSMDDGVIKQNETNITISMLYRISYNIIIIIIIILSAMHSISIII